MGIFTDWIRKNKEMEFSFDLDLIDNTTKKIYLKKMAISTCINYIARTMAQTNFQVRDNNKLIKDKLYFKLNVRPNTDDSAFTFWRKVFYKLIYDNECLIIKTDTDDFLIADSFIRNELAVYEDTFTSVIVKDYEFKRSFAMGEVLYLEYNNEKLRAFVDGMFEDFGELFGRMINAQLRNFQIRGAVNFKLPGAAAQEAFKEKLQQYVNDLYGSFQSKEIAIVPQLDGLNYEEFGQSSVNNKQSFDEITKLKNAMTDNVAEILGIPPALVHGQMADLESNDKSYMKYCIGPFLKMIEDEMNAKFFTESEFLKGHHINAVQKKDVLELAEKVDKLISSGTYSPNEIRDKLGDERVNDPELDKYYITKNYTEANSTKGGDDE
ncbi:phage portal protein [Listeria monocytogenes]|uniref:Phage portal protein n=1 Tax=Listeria monocytogenes TaxID=1639 RepID=A0A6C8MXK1_LISMN|nr:phage portal protein [Listeria monocytogenes]KAA9534127.1 phage portal protein [Listeria monocytogenes]KAA9541448.1 phage portal protein [Listeria monocytogenes]